MTVPGATERLVEKAKGRAERVVGRVTGDASAVARGGMREAGADAAAQAEQLVAGAVLTAEVKDADQLEQRAQRLREAAAATASIAPATDGRLRTLERRAVRAYLRSVRLPLTAVERMRFPDPAAPPAVLFQRFDGTVKRLVGNVLRDSAFIAEGESELGRAAALAEARSLETAAADVRRRSAGELASAQEQSGEVRERAERDAWEQELQARTHAEERKAAARSEATRSKRAVGTAKQQDEQHIDLVARERETAALASERRAVAAAKAAADREADVLRFQDAVARSKG